MANMNRTDNRDVKLVPSFPVRISDNGRYFVDKNGKPFFIYGDTGWKLFWEFTAEEAGVYLEDRKQKGFTVIQVQLLPHRDYQANRNGDAPFLSRGNMTTPNPAYFEHVDRIVGMAKEKGLGLLIAPAWASKWEQDWHTHLNEQNASVYANYLANRYKGYANIIGWIHGGDDDALELHESIRICARVMKEAAPGQLHTFHGFIKGGWQHFVDEPWYDFNMAYAYEYDQMLSQLEEAYSLSPVKPVFLGETHYEYNLNVTAAHIRKYAWTSTLLGTAGHTYGNKDIWMATYFWRDAMNAPAVKHLTCMKKMFDDLQWEKLVPDHAHTFVIEGYGSGEDFAPAAYTTDGSMAVVYIPSKRTVTVDCSKLGAGIKAFWFDPTGGMSFNIDLESGQEKAELETPGKNPAGDDDWVLLLRK